MQIEVQVEVNVQDYYFDQAEGRDDRSPIPTETWEIWFQRWLEYLQPELSLSQAYELSLRLTDDAEIQALNAQYRHKNQPTDVLAFAALEVNYPQLEEMQAILPLSLGDIVISVETAQNQAIQQEHSLQHELAWLAAHALLHLLGWDHPDEMSLIRMVKQQDCLLQAIGLNIGDYAAENSTEQKDLDTEASKL
ncbi:MAG: rRNA maturation RNase YbeY [Cyanobacteria bacterium CRU_2_1]|nr:rRNA maturation RNase YbeY [Cyanobacteria bacterium RU_5_0]NJR61618.1 rRNA maturation RNase YbeY [Cyanobacteria bacterium CRU_2_1]